MQALELAVINQSGYRQDIKINTHSRDSVSPVIEDGQSCLPSSAKQHEALAS